MVGSIQYGAEQAVKNCLRIQPGEKVVIITDLETKNIASELEKVARSVQAGDITTFVMEDYGKRPDDGINPLEFPDDIRSAFEYANVSIFAATRKKNEYPSFRKPLQEIVEGSETLRHAHMSGITEEIMLNGMCADYSEIQRISAQVADIVRSAEYIKVTAPPGKNGIGTNLTVDFTDYKWIVSDGLIKPGILSNLPDGEVYTCAYNANGIVVVDGVFGDYFDEKYGLLDKTPVTIEIENGRVKEMSCDDNQLLRDLQEYIKQDENANRIGEFAIGTNIGLDRLIGAMLQDEKFPGVHIAIGHGYPNVTRSGWDSKAHVDAVLRNVTIDVDGRVIMKNGEFINL